MSTPSSFPAHDALPSDFALPLPRQLSSKVVAGLVLLLMVGLVAIGYTLFLSWQLEGGGAAINAAGSLRMRTYQLGLLADRYSETHDPALALDIRRAQHATEATLTLLQQGDPARPLYLPDDMEVRQHFADITRHYHSDIAGDIQGVLTGSELSDWPMYRRHLDNFVAEIDQLVLLVEQHNSHSTAMLRISQIVLMAMAIIGTVSQIYLMFLLVFRPLSRLSAGMNRMGEKDFSVRLPVETHDEFGELTNGFNSMADHLAEAYGTLEARVEEKTAKLNVQNQELSLLYDTIAFLNQSHGAEAMCRGFLDRLMAWFKADGGSVRIIDPLKESAHMVTYVGISDKLAAKEHCLKPGDCLCGTALEKGVVMIQDLHKLPRQSEPYGCEREGFRQVSAFPMRLRQQQMGLLNLHFRNSREISPHEMHLIDTLGQHLAIALENLRLAARERELAVSEERNLLAQGLHDSIAQGLSFLNLQLQMLDDALDRSNLNDVREITPLLKAGVQESYEDVRELLLNFRSRLSEGDLVSAMQTTLDKFERQTGIDVEFTQQGDGAPLPPDDQLQILFILQEALSNVRKHADASKVFVRFDNEHDLRLEIEDNGHGIDEAKVAERADRHVGLRIMQERASRIGAQFTLTHAEHGGALVRLHLLNENRRHIERTSENDHHPDQNPAR